MKVLKELIKAQKALKVDDIEILWYLTDLLSRRSPTTVAKKTSDYFKTEIAEYMEPAYEQSYETEEISIK